MKVVLGHSEDIDSEDAIEEVLQTCRTELGDVVPSAGILIASIEHDFAILQQAILAEWPALELVGCTGDGEISSLVGTVEDSVALMLFASEHLRIRAGVGQDVAADPVAAAAAAVRQASEGEQEPASMAVIMPEGWGIHINVLLEAFQQELGPDTLLVGGMTSDAAHTGPTRQAFKGESFQDAVPCLLFFGPLKVSHAVRAGMNPVAGREHRVTKASGPIVSEIDGLPAVDLWTHYFGRHSIFNPLAVFPEDDGEFFIAAAAQILEDGSAYFFNPVPEGSVVKPADMTIEDTLLSAAESVAEAVSAYPGTRPDAALVFSCAGRRAALGTQVNKEIDLLRAGLPAGVPAIGYYTNGELCPLRGQRTTHDHGFSFVTVLIGEE